MAANAVVTNNFVQGTPANASDVNTNFSDVLAWINTNAVHLDGSKPLTGPISLSLQTAGERWSVVAAAASGTVNLNGRNTNAFLYTLNASANWTFNLRGDGSTTLDSLLAVGESFTLAAVVPIGATPYYATAVTLDGAAVTPKWLGVVPSAGTPNTLEVYTFVVVKTAATPTFTVLASKSTFV
jgi:hypothetical protein